jgi:hypothetical protein
VQFAAGNLDLAAAFDLGFVKQLDGLSHAASQSPIVGALPDAARAVIRGQSYASTLYTHDLMTANAAGCIEP